MHELYRRGLALGRRAVLVDVGNAADVFPLYTQEGSVLDAAKGAKHVTPADGIADLDHEGGGQFRPIRDQRVISRDLVGRLRQPTFLDVDHLLRLRPHRVAAFEVKRHVRSHRNAALAFDGADLAFSPGAGARVVLRRNNIGERQSGHRLVLDKHEIFTRVLSRKIFALVWSQMVCSRREAFLLRQTGDVFADVESDAGQ